MRFSNSIGRNIATLTLALVMIASIGLVGYDQSSTSLRVEHTLDTDRIFVRGSNANPELATVELRLDAPRQLDQIVADVMLVIDRSASFPVSTAVNNAKRIIDRLGPDDRVGIVSFATEATLDYPLTDLSNANEVKEALDELRDEGKTAMGEGIALAADELSFTGRNGAEWIQILLTDGRSNFGRDPIEAAENSGDEGVVIYAVGVGGSVNRVLLETVSEETGGRFFSAYSDSIVDEILRLETSPRAPVAENIEITATLTEYFDYESAIDRAPVVTNNSNGTTTLRWFVDDLQRDETWVARYRISSDEIGQFLRVHEFPTEIIYEDVRGREIHEDLPELRLDVRPKPPAMEAKFSLSVEQPTTFDAIQFTDNSTIEGPGEIVSWLWDFGDGLTSTSQHPTHKYNADGTYRVTLTVTSDEGVEAISSQEITVLTPVVSVRRTIDTFIPAKETIFGQRMAVTLHIRVNERVSGFGIDEEFQDGSGWDIDCTRYPQGFEVNFRNSSSGSIPVDFKGSELQWLFQTDLQAGSEITLKYDVKVPDTAVPGDFKPGNCVLPETERPVFTEAAEMPLPANYTIAGEIFSASPKLDGQSTSVTGDSSVAVKAGFKIKVIIAHWNTATNKLDLEKFRDSQGHKISAAQLQQARTWWEDQAAVKGTATGPGPEDNLQMIDFEVMNCLTAYHIEQISVFDKLPDSASSCNGSE